MFQQIIVPLDGSEDAAEAIAPAATLARRIGAPMHVVALHPPQDDPSELESTVLAQADSTGDVTRMVEVRPMEHSVATDLRRLAAAAGPSLIVMASHGRGRSAAFVGSVADELLSHPGQPVMLIGPGYLRSRFRTHGPAIVAVTGEADDDVLNLTSELLGLTDFEPVVAHVVDPKQARVLEGARSGSDGSDLPTDAASAKRAALRLGASTDQVVLDYDVYHDDKPADALVELATGRRASVIVMATHARQGLDRIAAGSVTSTVVRNAPCPVLVTGLSE